MSMTFKKTEVSLIRKMTEECDHYGGLNLGQGLCTLPPHPAVMRAAEQAIKDGHNSYVSAQGISELRRALSRKLLATNSIEADADTEILVTSGATGGYIAALFAVCKPGDPIVLVEPFYGYHSLLAQQAGLDIHTLEITNGGPNALREQLDVRTDIARAKAIVICTPSNPSGRVFSREELLVILDWAEANNVWIITDETYEYYVYDGRRHVSPASIAGRDAKVISIFSFSKTYSVPGWRLGYLIAPQGLLPRLITLHDRFYICPPTPFQWAALAALNLDNSYYMGLQNEFADRRDLLCKALAGTPLKPVVPAGAYYLWVDIKELGLKTAFDASMHILKVAGVASVPGSAFFASDAGERWIRFCFAVTQSDLEQAAHQLSRRLS